MKTPAKCVVDVCVRIVMMRKMTSGESLGHSSDLVIIATKTCVGHVESIAYAGSVTLPIAHYVQKMMGWMLVDIVKVTVVKRTLFALDAE